MTRIALWVLCAFTAFTLAGYASFGLHPRLLVRFPEAAGVYGIAFRFFAVGHVLIAGAVLLLFLTLRAGRRWLPAFAALYAISLCSELLGTSRGIPFGDYSYTPLLGAKWFGLVPLVIPLSWFFMALPSYALALRALPAPEAAGRRVLLASLLLASWDLALDPAMSHATKYWVWGEAGPYYGMPLLNLFGWYFTGLLLMGALAALRAEAWIRPLPHRWLAGFYLANLALPLGMSAAAGLWGAVAATLAALLVAYGTARLLSSRVHAARLVEVRA
ncbi:MAG TPA: carotenoid biosynthesis protein [Longimicrobium sp.]|nr:carotenoid biosynthesis protein [Longimicrobium sp.]